MEIYPIPLFPLELVVCPGGRLPLRIFEARYLDMVRNCMRNNSSFAIVTILPEGDTDPEGSFPFANVGTVVKIAEADVTTVGLMMITCIGQQRIKIESFAQQADGLVIGQVQDIPNDLSMPIPEDLMPTQQVLKQLLSTLTDQDSDLKNLPIAEPYDFDNATWVSNRWVELLDLPLLNKHRLMQMDSPILRLELINDILYANQLR
ncbi:LON peptidase substrate-binding domain-containing protein [Methylotenera sp.]|uniref:LON peptidase substrate-binding domain-containing protein n=1 Tax=Methylotenera sp. TaxID=2051956 RepID=UPI002487027E|nr:LON peptidase substrate-binding domain-containing protein [Methylotenera sp.]MDI1297844.1 LON peptidase substrate-binding domain-containing protein [Methylotenera sp.]